MVMPHHQPMKPALVVGGVPSYVRGTVEKKLARWGFVIADHHEMGKGRHVHVPKGVAAVIVFYDMVAHHQSAEVWKHACAESGVPCVMLPRKESLWPGEMTRHGFGPINPNTAAAVAENEEPDVATEKQKELVRVVSSEPRLSPTAAFMDRKETLRRLLREMAEKDGLKEVMFSPDSGLSLKRVAIEEFNEEV